MERENEEIVRELMEEVLVEGNLDRVDELVADDFVGHSNLVPGSIHGPEEYKKFLSKLSSGMSDVEYTFEDVIVEDEKVAVRGRSTGTHDGEFKGIEPTGKEVEIEGMYIARIEDGQIVESWGQNDMFGALQQLGVVGRAPPRATQSLRFSESGSANPVVSDD